MAFSYRTTHLVPSKKGKGGRCVCAEKQRDREKRESEFLPTLLAVDERQIDESF
jgi:hypothetical protein